MGRSDHLYVSSTIHSDQIKNYSVDLRGGQFIEQTMGCGPAEGGTTFTVTWSVETSFQYLIFVANELGIPYFICPYDLELVYFQVKYESAFAECVIYVDRTLLGYENKRSLLDRWFGPVCKTEWNSEEASAIRKELRRILKNVKTNYS